MPEARYTITAEWGGIAYRLAVDLISDPTRNGAKFIEVNDAYGAEKFFDGRPFPILSVIPRHYNTPHGYRVFLRDYAEHLIHHSGSDQFVVLPQPGSFGDRRKFRRLKNAFAYAGPIKGTVHFGTGGFITYEDFADEPK